MLKIYNDGYVVVKNLISAIAAKEISSLIEMKINAFALELQAPLDRYLYCTGRWANPSPVVQIIPESLNINIQKMLNKAYGQQFEMKKANIIVKCKNIKDDVPFHQDISYSYDHPYSFSVWLSLNDVDTYNGPLQVIPGSHKWAIEPAVDFWSANFVDNIRRNYSTVIKEICLEAGDAIIFNSRLWHGSKRKFSFKNRFAYVSRWVNINEVFSYIPPPVPSFFGMWTADTLTYNLLSSKLKIFMDYIAHEKYLPNLAYPQLLEIWKQVLSYTNAYDGVNATQAIRDLDNLLILKEASSKHFAGDLAGKIYKNLWKSLLQHIHYKKALNSGIGQT